MAHAVDRRLTADPAASRTVLITGATGVLGPSVIEAFVRQGWSVRTLSRRPPSDESAAAAHPHTAADIEDEQALQSAMTGVAVVVHLAALLHVTDPAPARQSEYRRVNVGGTEAVVRAARAAGISRLVFVSSIAVYGACSAVADEDTAPAPDTLYGVSKLQAEHAARTAIAGDGGPLTVVLRLAAVYGPSVKGNYARLVRALSRRRFVGIGSAANRRTLIFEEDAARAIVLAASHPAAAGEIFNVTDGQVYTVRQITTEICRALGRRPPRLTVPLPLARMLVASTEVLFRGIGRRPPVTTTTLEKYTEEVAVSGRRLRDALGFEPMWSLEEGWRETVRGLERPGDS